ncbi:CRISPR-associated endonuclease Cas6/Csy4 [Marinomonas spartinae]|uniref:type I-F CRISPR-associated endoribonuclease Cas6/Csy4 n=1 Tax=Marinomonas spartinae TaxID=1792290 RepID=UPI00080900B6|nr:type I-F CRISPR-associated endoribonuclease Cas6/Csy4 [Marinomonas spartinae]SBS28470.1 CRISPR-associated endonuclease Cas6/Csy4 [Marinomonas spartinae]
MKYYIDMTLLPSDDIGVHFLWSKLMMQVHLALVEIQDDNKQVPIAVSFPKYQTKSGDKLGFIGNKLRLFARDKNDFEHLNLGKWLNRLEDYVHIKSVAEVPDNVQGYETFNRRCKSGSPDKHIRRRMKRHNETWEQAAEFFKGYNMEKADKDLPFIRMKSLHSDNEFCMSITRKEAELSNKHVMFNTYGLSAEGVLPKF